MRIAFILNSSGLYGANRSLLGLISYLREKNITCFAILPQRGDVEQEFEKMDVEYAVADYRSCAWYPGYKGAPFLVNIYNIPKIACIIRKWNVDIIHTNSSSHDIGIILAKLLRKKHVWHIREILEYFYDTKWIFPHLYKQLRYCSDAVICVSEYTYNYHAEKYPNPNMKVIYNPYDVKFYDIQREEFAPQSEVTILMAGGFAKLKRQIDSVKAIKILLDRGIENVRLVIAGGGEASLINEVKNYIYDYELQDKIELLDFVPDLREIRRNSDIALCCSDGEALPRVIVEGMLSELLAIGADSGGIAELIEHKRTGLLYEVGNSEQLADQIEYAVNHREECRKMVVAAKKYVIDNFELNHSGEKVVEIYNKLLDDTK